MAEPDGKQFDNEADCRKYEALLQEESAVNEAKDVVREQVRRFNELQYPEGRARTVALNHVLAWVEYDMIERRERYGVPKLSEPGVVPLKESA